MFKNKKIFITGGFGFVGAALTKRLLAEKAEVFLLKRKETKTERLEPYLTQINLVTGSLLAPARLKKDLTKIQPDYIFHLAAYGGHHSENNVKEILRVNFWGTFNLLTVVKELAFKAFVNTGSSSEYGYKKKPMKETDNLEPASFYAVAKAGVTYLCQQYARVYKKNIVTVRPFTVYGPGDNEDKFIPTAVKSCIEGRPFNLVGNISRHDYIYIEDLIEGYIKAIVKPGISGEVFNLGTGKQYTNEKVITFIEKAAGKKMIINKGVYQSHVWDTAFWVADISKAKRFLGWRPKVGIREGIRKILNQEL